MGLECMGTRAHVAPVPVDLRVRGGDGFVSKDSERAQPGGAGAGRREHSALWDVVAKC